MIFALGFVVGLLCAGGIAFDCHRRAQRWEAVAEMWEARSHMANAALCQMHADSMWGNSPSFRVAVDTTITSTGLTSTELTSTEMEHDYLRLVR